MGMIDIDLANTRLVEAREYGVRTQKIHQLMAEVIQRNAGVAPKNNFVSKLLLMTKVLYFPQNSLGQPAAKPDGDNTHL